MSGEGFLDPKGAASDAHEIREMRRQAIDEAIHSKVQALVDLVNECIDADRRARPSFLQRIALRAKNVYRRLSAPFSHNFGRNDMAEQQLLQRHQMILERGMIIFGHSRSPFDLSEPATPASTTHRLSETPE